MTTKVTIKDQVAVAQSPKDAMLVIAAALDEILALAQPPRLITADWTSEWDSDETHQQLQREWAAVAAATIHETEDHIDIALAPPTPEKLEARRMFERQALKLSEYLGDAEDWTEAYAKGGPLWLYHGNRDLVMSYPEGIRAALVSDLDEYDHQSAHEMARDILKQAGETGPGSSGMHVASGEIG